MRRGPSIRWLLLSVSALVLIVPFVAGAGLRFYDTILVQQTERKLIAEAAVIGELYRQFLMEEMQAEGDHLLDMAPPNSPDEKYFPVDPITDPSKGVLPPAPEPERFTYVRDGPEWKVGERLTPILARSMRINLSGIRVMDSEGCVVASTGENVGACLDSTPEVRRALAGSYGAVLRERWSDEPPPPITSISRRGRIRVFCALPIFAQGKVVGVVRMSRTSLDALKSLWLQRDTILFTILASIIVTAVITLYLSRRISRPVQDITAAAQAVSRGESRAHLIPRGLVPAEVHDLSQSLDRMTIQLTDRAEYIAEFAANASHELKTPITGIRGAAELLRDQWEDMTPEQRSRFINNIDDDARRMEMLVTRMLELARIQNAPDESQAVELIPYVQDLQDRYGERLEVNMQDFPEVITINPIHLDSAVRNLVENAIRYGGEKPVELKVERHDNQCAFYVRDHGPGISEANQKRIFERFFTTHRDRGGTGLGLAIVKAVAEARGGSVTFDTGPSGTTFSLVV